ncbi:hypothetical protein JKP88DRAFT_323791 [Tribonema minus]|uniref:polyribonucleotide nucleotidyltransferase n=1 Tax=Tribonema minus TaxID=303371 RepID=A0A836CCD4_9STRA|nr:hypothetical protein JKP88DRAFT_323791 [Tribonema minus]
MLPAALHSNNPPPLPPAASHKVLSTLQATDGAGDAVTMAINSASAALMMSTIPFAGPVAAVRVGRIDGWLVVNPDVRELAARGTMDLLYAGTETRTLMIEFSGSQVPEAEVIDALQLAHRELQPLLSAQADLAASAPPADLTSVRNPVRYKDYHKAARKAGYEKAFAAMTDASLSKAERGRAEGAAMSAMIAAMREHAAATAGEGATPQWLALTADTLMRNVMSDAVISEKVRSDGRRVDEVRPITAEADVLPIVHGSALFTRGQTQALCTVTLGPSPTSEAQRYLGGTKLQEKRAQAAPGAGVYLHYEFPPYSVNESYGTAVCLTTRQQRRASARARCSTITGVSCLGGRDAPHGATDPAPPSLSRTHASPHAQVGKVGGVNRRMVGHGNLAEKAIVPVMPPLSEFPYTTRITSEVTMSNGSSSMATACAASLALMDAGVPIRAPVAGVSIGMVSHGLKAANARIAGADGGAGAAPAAADAAAAAAVAVRDDWEKGQYALLTDILGSEDHYGDMDFKVVGTAQGITAIQLDVKLAGGVPLRILEQAVDRARTARLQILKIVRFDPVRKRDIVGPGGTTLREIEEQYDVNIDLSEDGIAKVFSQDPHQARQVKVILQELSAEIERLPTWRLHSVLAAFAVPCARSSTEPGSRAVIMHDAMHVQPAATQFLESKGALPPSDRLLARGAQRGSSSSSSAQHSFLAPLPRAARARAAQSGDVMTGTVTEIRDFGAMVEVLRGRLGVLHVSEVSHQSGSRPVTSLLTVGQKLQVKALEVDPLRGLIKLSRKALFGEDETDDLVAAADRRTDGQGDETDELDGGADDAETRALRQAVLQKQAAAAAAAAEERDAAARTREARVMQRVAALLQDVRVWTRGAGGERHCAALPAAQRCCGRAGRSSVVRITLNAMRAPQHQFGGGGQAVVTRMRAQRQALTTHALTSAHLTLSPSQRVPYVAPPSAPPTAQREDEASAAAVAESTSGSDAGSDSGSDAEAAVVAARGAEAAVAAALGRARHHQRAHAHGAPRQQRREDADREVRVGLGSGLGLGGTWADGTDDGDDSQAGVRDARGLLLPAFSSHMRSRCAVVAPCCARVQAVEAAAAKAAAAEAAAAAAAEQEAADAFGVVKSAGSIRSGAMLCRVSASSGAKTDTGAAAGHCYARISGNTGGIRKSSTQRDGILVDWTDIIASRICGLVLDCAARYCSGPEPAPHDVDDVPAWSETELVADDSTAGTDDETAAEAAAGGGDAEGVYDGVLIRRSHPLIADDSSSDEDEERGVAFAEAGDENAGFEDTAAAGDDSGGGAAYASASEEEFSAPKAYFPEQHTAPRPAPPVDTATADAVILAYLRKTAAPRRQDARRGEHGQASTAAPPAAPASSARHQSPKTAPKPASEEAKAAATAAATTPDDGTPAPSPTAAEAEVAAPAAATAHDDSMPAPSPAAAVVAAEDAAEARPAPSVFDALLAPKKAPAKRRSAKAPATASAAAGEEEEQALTALSKADLIAKARALGVAMYGSKVAIAQRILAAQKKGE